MASTDWTADYTDQDTAQKLKLLADISDSALAYVDINLCFELTNRVFEDRFGEPSDGITAGKFFDGVCSPAIDDYLATAMTSRSALSARLDCRGLSGRTDRLRLRAVPHVENQQVNGLFVCFEALERRPLPSESAPGADPDARLAHLQRMAKLGEMSAGLAHEIRQPLSAITNYAGALIRLLRNNRTGPRILELTESIAEQAHRADQIIRNARSMIGQGSESLKRFDLLHVVEDSISLIERRGRELGVDIRLVQPHALPSVYGNAPQIEQILVNLLTNALDVLADCDRRVLQVQAHVDQDNACVRIAVRDSGPGIPPDRLSRVFNAFDTTKHDGMGMGLSISRALAERHGGRLWAENNVRGGARFILELPVAGARAARPTSPVTS